VWVVLDGSTDGSAAALAERGWPENALRIFSLGRNSGKGAAVLHALLAAGREGFTHALVLDADGQHSAADISRFMQASGKNPGAMILGVPQFAADAPAARRHGRRVGNWWANLETFWGGIEDSLFGFRSIIPGIGGYWKARVRATFDFDTELAVRLSGRRAAGQSSHAGPYFQPAEGAPPTSIIADNWRSGGTACLEIASCKSISNQRAAKTASCPANNGSGRCPLRRLEIPDRRGRLTGGTPAQKSRTASSVSKSNRRAPRVPSKIPTDSRIG